MVEVYTKERKGNQAKHKIDSKGNRQERYSKDDKTKTKRREEKRGEEKRRYLFFRGKEIFQK